MTDGSANTKKKVPPHIGVIIHGNRRWSQERNLPIYEGHAKGFEIIKKVPEYFFKRGVKIVSIFAFSQDNWKSSPEEVNHLMKLIKKTLEDMAEIHVRKGFRLLISGRMEELPGDLPEVCAETINITKDGRAGTVNLCLNYSGRYEIVEAIKKIIKNGTEVEQVHEGLVWKYLYNGELGEIDMVVNTSGEMRLSDFGIWQSAFAQYLTLKKFWPEFEESDVEKILAEYNDQGEKMKNSD